MTSVHDFSIKVLFLNTLLRFPKEALINARSKARIVSAEVLLGASLVCIATSVVLAKTGLNPIANTMALLAKENHMFKVS